MSRTQIIQTSIRRACVMFWGWNGGISRACNAFLLLWSILILGWWEGKRLGDFIPVSFICHGWCAHLPKFVTMVDNFLKQSKKNVPVYFQTVWTRAYEYVSVQNEHFSRSLLGATESSANISQPYIYIYNPWVVQQWGIYSKCQHRSCHVHSKNYPEDLQKGWVVGRCNHPPDTREI